MKALWFVLFFAGLACAANSAQDVKPIDATRAIIQAFDTHSIVMFGEVHANKQEYEFLRALVSFPQFADKVDDIVVEYETLYIKRLWIATSPVKTCPSKKSRRLGGIRWRWALYHRSILPCTKPSG